MKKSLISLLVVCVLVCIGFAVHQFMKTSEPAQQTVCYVDYWADDSILGDPALTEQLKEIMGIIVSGDKESFASLVSYPFTRPYPLHNIKDSAEMVSYFDTLVDDSLIDILKHTHLSDWEEVGWRGWTFADGNYFWFDGGIPAWDYLSKNESKLYNELVNKEWNMLPTSLKGEEWTVYDCLLPESGPYKVVRMDCRPDYDEQDQYRLAFYKMGTPLTAEPDMVLLGDGEEQGNMGTMVFNFKDQSGHHADFIYSADEYLDEEGLELNIFEDKQETYKVHFCYWLDLLK